MLHAAACFSFLMAQRNVKRLVLYRLSVPRMYLMQSPHQILTHKQARECNIVLTAMTIRDNDIYTDI